MLLIVQLIVFISFTGQWSPAVWFNPRDIVTHYHTPNTTAKSLFNHNINCKVSIFTHSIQCYNFINYLFNVTYIKSTKNYLHKQFINHLTFLVKLFYFTVFISTFDSLILCWIQFNKLFIYYSNRTLPSVLPVRNHFSRPLGSQGSRFHLRKTLSNHCSWRCASFTLGLLCLALIIAISFLMSK